MLSPEERVQLARFATSRALPHGLVRRAQIILRSADGETGRAIARSLGVSIPLVGHWRKHFRAHGVMGLNDAPRSGRPRTHDDDRVATLLRMVLRTQPKDATPWSVRSVATKTGISKSTVQRYLRLFGVQPHRMTSFTLSTDPFFLEKVRDVVGLYLNPPENAFVLCVDEKGQIQALERTQPILPMGLGYIAGVTHTYLRHGTTTRFAARDIQSGEVLTQRKARHRHQAFLAFLGHIEANIPARFDVHRVLDTYATHKHPKVRAWRAKRPRYHVHFTPTYASWLNQVERWFGVITQRAIRRGSFRTVRELVRRIDAFVQHDNRTASPFVWSATAESLLAKVERIAQAISGTRD